MTTKISALAILGMLSLSACGVQNSLAGSGGSTGSIGSAGSAGSGGSSGNSSGGSSGNSSGGSFGSFGGQETEAVARGEAEYIDPRAFVNVIKSISSERTRGGTILRVVGEVPSQGYYNVALVPVEDDNPRELLFEFRASAPTFPQAGPTVRSREIYASVFVSERLEPGVRTLRVRGLDASRTVRR